jgi:hypothetical protein
MNGLEMVRDDGHALGRQAAAWVALPVPRSLWQSKADPTGNSIAKSKGYRFQNLGSPFWIEGYVDFGVLGAVVLGGTFGWVGSRISVAWNRDRRADLRDPGLLGSLYPFFAAYQIVLLRGSIQAVIGAAAVWFLVLYFCSAPSHRSPIANHT